MRRQPGEAVLLALDRGTPTPAANDVAKMPYEITAIPTWIVSSGGFWSAGTSWLDLRRQGAA